MLASITGLISIFFFSYSIEGFSSNKKYLRPCYFTNWAQYRSGRAKFVPEDYVPGLCTHILYAFGGFDTTNFTLKVTDATDLPNENDALGLYARVNKLKKYDKKLLTLLSIGGWGFVGFENMTASAENRKAFIKSVIPFLRKHDFDGLDLDWEYPNNKTNFNCLLSELKSAFRAESKTRPLLLTAAVSAGSSTIDRAYDVPQLAKYLDWVNLMSYDFHGTWESVTGMNSPLYSQTIDTESSRYWNINGSAYYWHSKGMPKEKIIIGFASYGHGWTLSNTSNNGIGAPTSGAASATEYVKTAGTGAYYEFCDMLVSGAQRVFDNVTKVPYLVANESQWFSYDDVQSYNIKLEWIRQNKFGGAFVWTLDFDDFNGKCPGKKLGCYPLIGTIARILGGVKLSKPISRLMN